MVQVRRYACSATSVALLLIASLTFGARYQHDATPPQGTRLSVTPTAFVFLRCPGGPEPDLAAVVTVWVGQVAARVLPVTSRPGTRGVWCDSAPATIDARAAGAVLT